MPTITGTQTANVLAGGAAADLIAGLAGGDRISGNGGRDTISGGEGRDSILGGAGNDVLYGFGASDLTGAGDLRLTAVAGGLDTPVFVTAAPGDPDRLYVVEKTGQIRILNPETGTTLSTPFLDLPLLPQDTGGEQGLLGLAFHPDYATNGRFFFFMTNADDDLEIREGSRSAGNPDRAEAATDVIMTIPHPDFTNHNGGWIGFGPDGMLHIATGDGGGGGDPDNNAQDLDSLLGKILRIDVDGDDFAGDPGRDYAIPTDNPFADTAGADEIWAYGLRNPWRPSFDRQTGDFYIADVGQGEREEVNWQPASSDGGENYGWRVREGSIDFDGDNTPDSPAFTDPVIDYRHDATGGFSITGGYVYRGQAEGMEGVYFYADFITDQLWSFRMAGGQVVDAANRTAQLEGAGGSVSGVVSFGEDGRGNLFIVQINGTILRLDPQAGAGDLADTIRGGDGDDRILGGVGNDVLAGDTGADTLWGNRDNDSLAGGSGLDALTGGRGDDRFVFQFKTDSGTTLATRDRITDFDDLGDDQIGLASLDAREGTAGDQAFTFIGTANFTGEGQVRLYQQGADVVVSLNTRGTFTAEVQILLAATTLASVTASDFVL